MPFMPLPKKAEPKLNKKFSPANIFFERKCDRSFFMQKIIRKNIESGVLIGLLFAVMLSIARFDTACRDLRSNVLRLHIIANSDSEADQTLKLRVRDAILEGSELIFEDCTDLDSAAAAAKSQTDAITDIANSVIEESGLEYTAVASVEDCCFETREYEDFTLPAGIYKSVVVRLGEAEGKNWWCVVFPAVCLPAASDAELSDTVGTEGVEIAENPQRYIMKFKAVEWYEDIKQFFKSK